MDNFLKSESYSNFDRALLDRPHHAVLTYCCPFVNTGICSYTNVQTRPYQIYLLWRKHQNMNI